MVATEYQPCSLCTSILDPHISVSTIYILKALPKKCKNMLNLVLSDDLVLLYIAEAYSDIHVMCPIFLSDFNQT